VHINNEQSIKNGGKKSLKRQIASQITLNHNVGMRNAIDDPSRSVLEIAPQKWKHEA
jgi:hypothetical protein